MNKVIHSTKLSVEHLLSSANLFCLALLILSAIMFFLEMTKPKPTYFVRDTAGNTAKMLNLNEPNVSTDTLLRWVSLAVTNAYTLDFVDYQQQRESLRNFFTKAGYKNFLEATESRLQGVIKQKLIVTAVVSGTPVLLEEGSMSGFYAWRIQLPLLLSYQGASEKSTKENLAVSVLIMRMPTKEASTGIGIAQIQDATTYNN